VDYYKTWGKLSRSVLKPSGRSNSLAQGNSSCGHINKIGSKSIIKCKCGLTIDRDLNGARGIFLKNMSLALGDTPFPVTMLLGLPLLANGDIG
jgi:hypothetical protein